MAPDSPRRQELVEETLGLMRRVLSSSIRGHREHGRLSKLFAKEHVALHYILRTPGATHSDLARFLGATPSRISGIVDSLEKRGLVKRIPDEADRRIHHLEPTARAIESHRRLHERFGQPTTPIFDGWTEAEIESLRAMLQRLDVDRKTLTPKEQSDSSEVRRL